MPNESNIGPIDYMSMFPQEDFLKNIQTGFKLGADIQQVRQKRQEQQMAAQRAADYKTRLAAAIANPTPQAFATLTGDFPEYKEAHKQNFEQLSEGQRQTELKDVWNVASALHSDRPELAVERLDERITALKNSGMPTAEYDAIRGMIQRDHKGAYGQILHIVSGMPGGDKILENLTRIGIERRNKDLESANLTIKGAEARKADVEADIAETTAPAVIAKADLDNRNLANQIFTRSGQLGLDRDKFTSEVQLKLQELGQAQGKLDDSAKKIINESTVGAVASRQAATQMTDLATQFENANPTSLGAGVYEWLKNTTGNQNYVSSLRREYSRVVTKEVLGSLPPGPATDRDVAMAREGFLKSTADPTQVASFLRGMAKLQNYNAQIEDAKAEWVNSVGHLGRAKTDIAVGSTAVPAGTTYSEFIARVLKPIGAQTQPPGRSYMRFAKPPVAPATAASLDPNRQGD